MGCLCVWSVVRAQSIKPNGYSDNQTTTIKSEPTRPAVKLGQHSIRSEKTISEEALRQYLANHQSPLATYTNEIISSQYWSTIIAICTIEEYSCSVNPYESNNLWGLMAGGHLIRFPTLGDGLVAINRFLSNAEANGRTTIESFAGWYCYDASRDDHVCPNWQAVVIGTKTDLESR